jgi:flagellar biosynthetic protein FliQ
MSPQMVADISREALYLTLKISLPLLLSALIVGIVISLLQALTQIQEQTLTFVPKIIAIFAVLIMVSSFMSNSLISFTHSVMQHIQNAE